jgi:hypothetical protein
LFLLGFLTRRLLQGAVVLLIVTFAIFTLLRVVPGDPARLIVGGMAPDEVVVQKAQELGLNDPIPVQFARYLGDMLQGDFGSSFFRPKNGATVGAAAYDDPTRDNRAAVLDLILQHILAACRFGSCLRSDHFFPAWHCCGSESGEVAGQAGVFHRLDLCFHPEFLAGDSSGATFFGQIGYPALARLQGI